MTPILKDLPEQSFCLSQDTWQIHFLPVVFILQYSARCFLYWWSLRSSIPKWIQYWTPAMKTFYFLFSFYYLRGLKISTIVFPVSPGRKPFMPRHMETSPVILLWPSSCHAFLWSVFTLPVRSPLPRFFSSLFSSFVSSPSHSLFHDLHKKPTAFKLSVSIIAYPFFSWLPYMGGLTKFLLNFYRIFIYFCFRKKFADSQGFGTKSHALPIPQTSTPHK